MIPLTENPKIVVLVEKGVVFATSNNISPNVEMVVVYNDALRYEDKAEGIAYDTNVTEIINYL